MARPKENTSKSNSNVASIVMEWINEPGAPSQVDIAEALDLPKPNVITMIKTGRTKLPMRHVVPLARALQKDPEILMDAVLEEYFPEINNAISLSKKKVISSSESKILETIRKAKSEVDKQQSKRSTWRTDKETLSKLTNFAKEELLFS